MTQPERDDEFEAFLKHRTVLPHGLSVDDKLEPPAALDAKVLSRAREAIHADKRSQRAPRWVIPMAIAATVLLSFSIVMNVSLNTNRPAVNQQSSTVALDSKPAGEQGVDEAKDVVVTGQRREAEEDRLARAQPPASPAAPILDGSAPAPAASAPPAPADTRTAQAASRAPAASAPAAPALAESVRPVPADTLTARNAARTPAASAPAASAAPALAASAPPALESRAAPTAALPPPSPSDAAEAPLAKEEVPPASMTAANALEESVVTARRVAKSKRDSDAQTAGSAAAAPHPRDPKTWLKQIDALRAKGQTDQADAEMQRFRAAFPNYPLKPAPADGAAKAPTVPNSQ